jgi:hypothetical protein
MVASRSRVVERVPTLLIGLLGSRGLLPPFPDHVAALETRAPETPTAEEQFALKWSVVWHGRPAPGEEFARVAAVAGYRDVYDYPSQSRVREIVHLAGRSSMLLLKALGEEARADGRRMIGDIAIGNEKMNRALRAHGYVPTRTRWESVL